MSRALRISPCWRRLQDRWSSGAHTRKRSRTITSGTSSATFTSFSEVRRPIPESDQLSLEWRVVTDVITPDLCRSEPSRAPRIEATPARNARVGPLEIRRALPMRDRRMVGPWCFLDRYGPLTFTTGNPMDLPPHPHIGLQTVSWLLDGELLHRDSLGSEVLLRAGGLNLMTAGSGITHSEDTPAANSGRLNGVQLWVALPDASRNRPPSFEMHPELPVVEFPGGRMTVILGQAAGTVSAASVFSPIVGADIHLGKNSTIHVPLRPEFEHCLFVLHGGAGIDGESMAPDILFY